MKKALYRVVLAMSIAVSAVPALAQEAGATPDDAKQRLKAIVSSIKAKGGEATTKELMSADDPFKCRYKDLVCMAVDISKDTILVHTAIPKLVGTKLDDAVVDVDGNSLTQLQFGPGKKGMTSWDAKYKFTRPDTKKIVPRWSFCEKADSATVVCASVSS